jgi:hypothetical protein
MPWHFSYVEPLTTLHPRYVTVMDLTQQRRMFVTYAPHEHLFPFITLRFFSLL